MDNYGKILGGALKNADDLPRVYRTPHKTPQRLPCRQCECRPAPDVEVAGMGWLSLLLCDVCQNNAERADRRALAQRQEEHRQEQTLKRWKAAGLDAVDMALPYKLDRRMEGMVRAVTNQGESWCRYLWGPPGTGKTTQAVVLTRELVQAGWRCLIVTEQALVNSLKPPTEGDPTPQRSTTFYVERFDLLVIDEVGRDGLTEWGASQMSEVLGRRLDGRERRPTVLTTNLSLLELERGPLGRRISGRVMEATGEHGSLHMTIDYRARNAGLGAA